MRQNEVEISGVPDEPPPQVKKNLRKEKKKKPNIEEATRNVPPISSSYQAMHIDPRGPEIQLDNVEQMSPFDLFSLYIMPLHLELIAIRTNYNAENKQTQATE